MSNVEQEIKRIDEAAAYLQARLPKADLGVVLGSGLAALADMIEDPLTLSYQEIPHFPEPTVMGHRGNLLCGKVGGKTIYAFSGRFHYYEGHDPATVVLLMRVLHRLGCDTVFLTNAAGGVNLDFTAGDLMLITDHINFMGYNPLRGTNLDAFGPRFPDMSMVYDRGLQSLAETVAKDQGFPLQKGVYCGFSGPSFETPAEIRMARILGGDAVGMSTVPEAIVARHMSMRVLGISCITNLAAGVTDAPLSHEEVFANGKQAEKRFSALIAEIIRRM